MTRPFLPTAVLEHTFEGDPDLDHLDWLLETEPGDDPDARTLIAFRLATIPHEADSFDATRLDAHRRHYLTYEGPIPGDRGRVRRVASGEARVTERDDGLTIDLRTDDGVARRIVGRQIEADRWRFIASDAD